MRSFSLSLSLLLVLVGTIGCGSGDQAPTATTGDELQQYLAENPEANETEYVDDSE